jgi:hypothetical protein
VLFRDNNFLAESYSSMAATLRLQCNTSPAITAAVALVCIYSFDVYDGISDHATVQAAAMEASALLYWAVGHALDTTGTLATLRHMADLFEANVTWIDNEEARSMAMARDLPMPFTQEEEAASDRIRDTFNAAIRKANFGDEDLAEYFMWCHDVPFSKSAMMRAQNVFVEKIWNVLKDNPEFCGLSSALQLGVWLRSGVDAAMLLITKMHSYSAPMDQLRFCWGELDMAFYARTYEGFIDHSRLKPISFSAGNADNPINTHENMRHFDAAMSDLFDLLRDDDHFRMITLIVMFSVAADPFLSQAASAIEQARAKYERLFSRQLTQRHGAKMAERVLSRLTSKLPTIRSLATFALKTKARAFD